MHGHLSHITTGALPSASLENIWERWSTLMSLWELVIPKKDCQLHRSFEATTPRIVEVGALEANNKEYLLLYLISS
jgi:hypothetical protein